MGVPFWICVLALKEYFFPPKVTMVIPKTLPKHKPLCTSKHKFRQTTTWIWEFLGFLCFFTHPAGGFGGSGAHHEVLEEPWAHDVGGVFGQDSPFVLGFLVLTIKEGGEIQVHLSGQKEWGENWLEMVMGNAKNEQKQHKMGVGWVKKAWHLEGASKTHFLLHQICINADFLLGSVSFISFLFFFFNVLQGIMALLGSVVMMPWSISMCALGGKHFYLKKQS